MNILLWVLQALFGLYFIGSGVMHFAVPPGLPPQMSWMYELSPALHAISGTAEILGGVGLILPGVTGLPKRLVPLAGLGLALVMVGAMVWHLSRGEGQLIVLNLVLMAICGFVAYGRWKLRPLGAGSGAARRSA